MSNPEVVRLPQPTTSHNRANIAYKLAFGEEPPDYLRFTEVDDEDSCNLAILCYINRLFNSPEEHWITSEFSSTFHALVWFDEQYPTCLPRLEP